MWGETRWRHEMMEERRHTPHTDCRRRRRRHQRSVRTRMSEQVKGC